MNVNRIKIEPIDNPTKTSLPRIFICEKCQIRFSNIDTLNAHRRHYCRTNTKRSTYTIDSILMKGIKRQLTDDYSSISMKRFAIWKFNNPIDKMIYIPISLFSSSIQNQPLDLTKPKSKPIYRCQFCSIHFLSLKTLQAHQQNYCVQFKSSCIQNQIESQAILFKCTICCAMFDNEDKYFKHIDYVHTNQRFMECLECQSRFSSKWNLIQHMKLSHANMKPVELHRKTFFSCSFCQIKFQKLETLEEHMRNYCVLRVRKQKSILTCTSCKLVFQHQSAYRIHQTFYCPYRRTTN